MRTSIFVESFRAGVDEFRHLPARSGTRPQHVVRYEDQHLPSGGRETGAGVHGLHLPIMPPLKVNVKNKGERNTFRILMDWPRLQVWVNGEVVQDLDVETVPELRHRLRSRYTTKWPFIIQ